MLGSVGEGFPGTGICPPPKSFMSMLSNSIKKRNIKSINLLTPPFDLFLCFDLCLPLCAIDALPVSHGAGETAPEGTAVEGSVVPAVGFVLPGGKTGFETEGIGQILLVDPPQTNGTEGEGFSGALDTICDGTTEGFVFAPTALAAFTRP